MANQDEVARYAWIEDTVFNDAACLTLVENSDADWVARASGALPDLAEPVYLELSADFGYEDPTPETGAWLAIKRLGPWVLVAEINGWRGTEPEVLERVSARSRALSLYWNVNMVTRFCYAVGGEIRTEFDAVTPEDRIGTDPDCLAGLIAGLDQASGSFPAWLLALAGRVTGQAIRPEWLQEEGFQLVPLPGSATPLAADIELAGHWLSHADRTLAWALLHADEESLHRAAMIAAERAVQATGLHSWPEVAAFSPAELRPSRPLDELAERLRLAAQHEKAWGDDSRPELRSWAVTALREAANPALRPGGFRAVEAAIISVRADEPARQLRAAVLHALGDPLPPSGSLGLTEGNNPGEAGGFRWLDEHWLGLAGAVMFVSQASVTQVAQVMLGVLDRARTGVPTLTNEPMAAIGSAHEWVVTVEWHNPKALRRRWRLPQLAAATCVTWYQGESRLFHSSQRRLRGAVDPGSHVVGTDPGFWAPYFAAQSVPLPGRGATGYRTAMLTAAQGLTVAALDPAWLDQPQLLVPLLPASDETRLRQRPRGWPRCVD